MSNRSFYHFPLGQFSCTALVDNRNEVDIREELGQVPEAELWNALQARGHTDFKVQIGFNNLLVQQDATKILIDCGTGQDQLVTNLAAINIAPEEIDYLVITHSDFDHIGGLDHFSNAKLVFPRKAYELWTEEETRREMIENFKVVFSKFLPPEFVARAVTYREHYGAEKLPSLQNRMLFVEPEETFLPGFRMVFTPGHRPDHYAVEIESEGQVLLHLADGFRHAIQVDHPQWYSRFDSYPEQMAESLALVMERAKAKKAILFGAHFKFPGLARLEQGRFSLMD